MTVRSGRSGRGLQPLWQDDRRSCSASSPPCSAARSCAASAGTCRRVRGAVDRRFFVTLVGASSSSSLIAALLITVVEKPMTFGSLGRRSTGAIQTILGQGDSSYVTSPVGWVVGWFFSLFGVAIIGTLTGALVALVIDFLLKEGQGLGASGYQDHIVVCGWNSTARDLIDELAATSTGRRSSSSPTLDKNPAGDGVYFVSGDSTDAGRPRAGRHRRGDGRPDLPDRRLQRQPTCARS